MRKPVTPSEAYERLAGLCAVSEHCTYEAYEKLRRWGIIGTRAREVVERLVDERYIDDRRFARAYVSDRLRYAHWGRRKVRQALLMKRVDEKIIDEALDNFDEDEYLDLAAHACRAKARTLPETATWESRTKLFRFMASRGFESSVISRVMPGKEGFEE